MNLHHFWCLQFGTLEDDILAYGYAYPKQTLSGKPVSLFPVRKPSRYSSVPPVSADASQRIVSELADFKGGVIISVSVTKPPEGIQGGEPADWSAGYVATAILDDR